jgi:hypothetical protein
MPLGTPLSCDIDPRYLVMSTDFLVERDVFETSDKITHLKRRNIPEEDSSEEHCCRSLRAVY